MIGAFFYCAVTSFSQLSENFYYNPPFIINNKNSCFMETGEDRHSRVCPSIETAERWNYLNYMSLTPHPNRRSKSPLVSYFQKKRHLHLYLTVITRPARPTSELSTEMGISKLSVLLSIIGKVCVLFLMLTSWILFFIVLLLLFEFDALTVNGRSVQVWIEFKSSQGTRSDDPL